MTIGSYKRQFTHLIRDAILFDNKIVVLLEIPFNDNTINNIYAVNRKCDILEFIKINYYYHMSKWLLKTGK